MRIDDEFSITVNGVKLNDAQVTTVRVALATFLTSMMEKGALGEDSHGEAMRLLYIARLCEIAEIPK